MLRAYEIRKRVFKLDNIIEEIDNTYNILMIMVDRITEAINSEDIMLKVDLGSTGERRPIKPPRVDDVAGMKLFIANEETYKAVFSDITAVLNDNKFDITFEVDEHRGEAGVNEEYDFIAKMVNGNTYTMGIDVHGDKYEPGYELIVKARG